MSKCKNCGGSGEEFDVRLFKVVDCERCDGFGVIQTHKDEYIHNEKKRFKKRVPKLGRDFELEERDDSER